MIMQRSSKQFVRIPVSATLLGMPTTAFTADVVKIAIVVGENPQTSDFVTAAWETDAIGIIWAVLNIDAAAYVAALGISAFPADTNAYVKITDSPEVPVLPSGKVTFV